MLPDMVKRSTDTLFITMAPAIMRMLMRDFAPFLAEDAAAVLGNLGHESGGFRFLQEKKPLVPGSRGGWGWAQWTGPRRKAFEAFISAHGFDPASADANYGFLRQELQTTEKAAIPAVRKARTLEAKVKAFELAFERASPKYKHYDSRVVWAKKALAALAAKPQPAPGLAPDLDDDMAAGLRQKAKVQAVQQSLTDLGYPVGAIDGRPGTLTVAAVAAYQHDRGQPVTSVIDDALIHDLMRADDEHWSRPISEERATMPEKEIAKKSATMRTSWWGKALAGLGLGGGTLANAAKDAIAPDQIDAHLSVAQRVIQFAGDNWMLLAGVVVAGLGAWGAFRIIDRFKVEDYREGRRA